MDLKQELRKLIELQKVDSLIYSLRRKKDEEYPLELEKINAGFEEKRKILSEAEEKVKQCLLRKKEKEIDLGTMEENVRKAKGQLYALKTNKEYHAKLTEIESLKANVSVIEEAVLNVMEEIETVEKELAVAKGSFSGEENRFREEEKKIKDEIAALEREISQHEGKKNIVRDTIDKKILSRYEHLTENRSGLGIAPVLNETCGACHMRVTPQTVNEIKMYKDIVSCASCLRILYLEEDL